MFSRFTIAQKILFIPFIGTIGFVLYLTISTITANQNVAHLKNAKEVQFPSVLLITAISHKIEKVEAFFNSAVTTGDEEMVESALTTSGEISKGLSSLKQLSKQSFSEITKIETLYEQYFKAGEELSMGMINETIDFSKLGAMGQNLSSTLEQLKSSVERMKQARIKELQTEIVSASDSGENLVSIGFGLGAFTIALLFIISVPISKSIQRSLLDVVSSLRSMADGEGDLTVRLRTKNQDEIGELVNWFNAFVQKLQDTISEVVSISKPLTEMAEKVNSSAREAKSETELQQQGIEQTRIAVSEMNASVQSIAENASQTADSVKSASELSSAGSKVVGQTVSSIGSLAQNVSEASSVVDRLEQDVEQVCTVLSVIRGIAEQTNLLALNAAIEAARAGEQGRGFAVVADEVRTLASRTQDSTTEIQTTIEKLQHAAHEAVETMNKGRDKAQGSVDEAARAGESLTAIENTVTEINSMTTNIATATEEQSSVAANIVNSVDDISSSTDRTSQSANKLADVSNELNNLATVLNQLTNGFKV